MTIRVPGRASVRSRARSAPSGAPAFSYLLDSLPTATGAYSTQRKLAAAYSGNLFRVRRSNDNAELDVGFSGNVVDVAAHDAHVGANSGFVRTMYPQVGAITFGHATAANQPRTRNAGVNETLAGGGLVARSMNGTGIISSASNLFANAVDFTVLMVVRCAAYSGGGRAFYRNGGTGLQIRLLDINTGGRRVGCEHGGAGFFTAANANSESADTRVFAFRRRSGTYATFRNDPVTPLMSGASGTALDAGSLYYSWAASGDETSIAELIIWQDSSLDDAQLATAMSNCKAYWGVA